MMAEKTHLTDEQIIQALINDIYSAKSEDGVAEIYWERLRKILSLINRQRKEIERLEKENHRFADIGKFYSEIRAEVIKEYTDKVKQGLIAKGFFPVIVRNVMADVAKEMEVNHG